MMSDRKPEYPALPEDLQPPQGADRERSALPGHAALVRLRAHAPWATHGELSVGEGMISSESRMREICMSGSTSGDWKRSHGEE